MLDLFLKLKEAYETTTHNNNRFEKALKSVNWDAEFEADGEIYFIKGCMTLTIQNLNPFEEEWKPSAIFEDGSYIEF